MEPRLNIPRSLGVRETTDLSAPSEFTFEGGESDGQHPRDMLIKLEPEFYTCAFVSPLQLGQKREHYERICGECFFVVAMFIVAAIQCITVLGMSAYLVEREAGYTDEFKLSMALFTEGGSPMSLGNTQDVCGSFNQIALGHIAGAEYLRMSDGTRFEGGADVPIFHSYKMPSGTWAFNSISGHESYVDKLLRVLYDLDWSPHLWAGTLSDFRVQYGTLFVIMLAVLWYHVLFELRKIGKFVLVLHHLYKKGIVKGRAATTSFDKDDGAIAIEHLNSTAMIVGCLCVTMRFAVVFMMLAWGTTLLTASWDKLSLVLNSLAIGIVFEIDVIIAYAVVDHNTMTRIENLKPIALRMPTWSRADSRKGINDFNVLFSFLMLVGVFVGACFVRAWQVDVNTHHLHNAAALCLFAGPTPQGRQDLLAPVPGFCESLLSLTCAPNVTGTGSDQNHGPCVVTDQNMFKDRSVMLYADSQLFENMYDAGGKRRSMVEWGEPRKQITESKAWLSDEHLNLFRRACVQLYQPSGTVDKRNVDASVGMTSYSAPFYCPRENLFKAVFGNAFDNFDRWRSEFDLQRPDIVAALDQCHQSPETPLPALEEPKDSSGNKALRPATVADSSSKESPATPSDASKLGDDSGHALPVNTLVRAGPTVQISKKSLRGRRSILPRRHHHHHVLSKNTHASSGPNIQTSKKSVQGRRHHEHRHHRELSRQWVKARYLTLKVQKAQQPQKVEPSVHGSGSGGQSDVNRPKDKTSLLAQLDKTSDDLD